LKLKSDNTAFKFCFHIQLAPLHRGWFSIDLASILPFDTLTAASGSSSGPLAGAYTRSR
jgi:hypothetical protein